MRARSSGHRPASSPKSRAALSLPSQSNAQPWYRHTRLPAVPEPGPHDHPGTVRADVVEAAQRAVTLDDDEHGVAGDLVGDVLPRSLRATPLVRTSPTRRARPLAARRSKTPGSPYQEAGSVRATTGTVLSRANERARSGHRRRRRRPAGRQPVPARRRRSVRRAARGAAVPQGRRHGVVPRDLRPLRRGRVRGLPPRPARHRLVGRRGDRRVPRRRTRRPPAGDRVAGAQPWSSGRVGMFGTSYSGFNSLHMAAEGVPALGAVVAMYATDDRYTDDVHYCGGVLRAIDLIDYVLYMVRDERPAAGAGVCRATAGATSGGGASTRRRRGCSSGCAIRSTGRCGGAARSGSDPAATATSGSRARRCSSPAGPTATATTRSARSSVRAQRLPWRLLAGPWSHRIPRPRPPRPEHRRRRARSSPSSTSTSAADRHRRRAGAGVRAPTRAPRARPRDARRGVARPRHVAAARAACGRRAIGRGRAASTELEVRGDVGVAAWISCAGALPWGQPLDQRADDARSLTYDWPIDDAREVLGNASCRCGCAASARRPRRGQVVRRVPRRHVGADHPRDAQPDPPRLLAGRRRRRRRCPTGSRRARRVDRRRRRARGDDVDARARPRRCVWRSPAPTGRTAGRRPAR